MLNLAMFLPRVLGRYPLGLSSHGGKPKSALSTGKETETSVPSITCPYYVLPAAQQHKGTQEYRGSGVI